MGNKAGIIPTVGTHVQFADILIHGEGKSEIQLISFGGVDFGRVVSNSLTLWCM